MKLRPHILAVITLCTLVACSEKVPEKTGASQASIPPGMKTHAALIKELEAANDTCRGKPGDSNEGMAACSKRDLLMADAEQAGLCWGPLDASGAEKHWILCSDDPLYKKRWYSQNLNHADCIESGSPADKMRMIQESGRRPTAKELPHGAVEVEVDTGNGNTRYWTYFRTMETCLLSLPRAQVIDKKYE